MLWTFSLSPRGTMLPSSFYQFNVSLQGIYNKRDISKNHSESSKFTIFHSENHPKLPETAENHQQASPIPTDPPTCSIIT